MFNNILNIIINFNSFAFYYSCVAEQDIHCTRGRKQGPS